MRAAVWTQLCLRLRLGRFVNVNTKMEKRVHVNTKVDICLVTEKMKSKKSGSSSMCSLMVFPKAHLSYLFSSRSEVVKSISYAEAGGDPVALYA